MGPLFVAGFVISCLLGIQFAEFSVSLCLSLFATKQLLQASANMFRDSQTGSQIINFMVGGAAATCAIKRLVDNPARIRGFINSSWILVVALHLWALTTCLWSYSGRQGFEAFALGLPYLLLFIIIIPLLVRDLDEWGRITGVWLVFATCVTGLILINPEFTVRSGRLGLDLGAIGLKSTRTNPLELGAIGGFCVILGVLYSSTKNKALTTVVRLISVLLGTALAVRSGSRGQFIFAVASAILSYPISKPVINIQRTLSSLIVLITILFAIVIFAEQVRTSGSLQEEQRWSASEFGSGADVRFANILLLLGEYFASPLRWITGLGFLSYSYLDPVQEYSHCLSADMLGELGLVGFSLYGAILVLSIRQIIRVFSSVAQDERRRNGLGCLVGILTYQMLLANKQGNLVGSSLLICFILILARIDKSLWLDENDREEFNAPDLPSTEPFAGDAGLHGAVS